MYATNELLGTDERQNIGICVHMRRRQAAFMHESSATIMITLALAFTSSSAFLKPGGHRMLVAPRSAKSCRKLRHVAWLSVLAQTNPGKRLWPSSPNPMAATNASGCMRAFTRHFT